MSLPLSLRIACGFVVALWIVGLIALAVGAPGDIIAATGLIGTVGAFVEWTAHHYARAEPPSPNTLSFWGGSSRRPH